MSDSHHLPELKDAVRSHVRGGRHEPHIRH